jgi:predicted metal-dependent hydrolase
MALFRREPPVFEGGGRRRQLIVKPNPQARRMRLAVDPRDGSVRLTLPKRASLRQALEWAEDKRAWVEAELARLPLGRPITPECDIPFEGRPVRVAWQAGGARTVRREADSLIVGGPVEALSNRILRWLRQEAQRVLDQETREIATRADVAVGKVSVGDPRGRWGSCSYSGDIRYSWRLIMAPIEVRRATVAHEVAHRLHMDHSPAFHAAAARLFGRDPDPERRWLRKYGSSLHWVGREG